MFHPELISLWNRGRVLEEATVICYKAGEETESVNSLKRLWMKGTGKCFCQTLSKFKLGADV